MSSAPSSSTSSLSFPSIAPREAPSRSRYDNRHYEAPLILMRLSSSSCDPYTIPTHSREQFIKLSKGSGIKTRYQALYYLINQSLPQLPPPYMDLGEWEKLIDLHKTISLEHPVAKDSLVQIISFDEKALKIRILYEFDTMVQQCFKYSEKAGISPVSESTRFRWWTDSKIAH